MVISQVTISVQTKVFYFKTVHCHSNGLETQWYYSSTLYNPSLEFRLCKSFESRSIQAKHLSWKQPQLYMTEVYPTCLCMHRQGFFGSARKIERCIPFVFARNCNCLHYISLRENKVVLKVILCWVSLTTESRRMMQNKDGINLIVHCASMKCEELS